MSLKSAILGRRVRSWHVWVFKRLVALVILLSGGCVRPAQPPQKGEPEHEWQKMDRIIGGILDPWRPKDDR